MKNSKQALVDKAYQYRYRFLELFTKLGFGHVTSAFSWAEIATVLYNEIIDFDSLSEPIDKMVVSKGHGVGMLFPVLEERGLISTEELNDSIRIGGSNKKLREYFYPGFDFYGGSLGMGLGVACGLAKSNKMKNDNRKVYCLLGDAECYEGAIWESVMFAAHNQLSNLIVIVDRNGLGCSNFTEDMIKIESFDAKWKAFNWDVSEVDGHDVVDVYEALYNAKHSKLELPHCIIAKTKKGKGLDYLVDLPLMHGYMPKGEEISRAFKCLK